MQSRTIQNRLFFLLQYLVVQNTIISDEFTRGVCHCAVNVSCRSSMLFVKEAIPTMPVVTNSTSYDALARYIAPRLVQACYTVDTVGFSTLECFHDRQVCFPNLLEAVNRSLVRFGMNLSMIIDAMMIERWIIDISFDQYYATNQPSYCTYRYILRH